MTVIGEVEGKNVAHHGDDMVDTAGTLTKSS
jgi:phosphoribosylpyrophosphate synthetase